MKDMNEEQIKEWSKEKFGRELSTDEWNNLLQSTDKNMTPFFRALFFPKKVYNEKYYRENKSKWKQ